MKREKFQVIVKSTQVCSVSALVTGKVRGRKGLLAPRDRPVLWTPLQRHKALWVLVQCWEHVPIDFGEA